MEVVTATTYAFMKLDKTWELVEGEFAGLTVWSGYLEYNRHFQDLESQLGGDVEVRANWRLIWSAARSERGHAQPTANCEP